MVSAAAVFAGDREDGIGSGHEDPLEKASMTRAEDDDDDVDGHEDALEMTSLTRAGYESGREAQHDSKKSPHKIELPVVHYVQRLLYLSHMFAQFSEVSWQFCLTLFLAAFTNYESMVLVSTYGCAVQLAVCLCGSQTGRIIDDFPRLRVAQGLICLENVAVALASLLCFLLLSIPTSEPSSSGYGVIASLDSSAIILLVGIHLLGALAQVCDQAFLVAIERDWVVVIARAAAASHMSLIVNTTRGETTSSSSHFTRLLSNINVTMKQIDLSCKVVAPAVAGLLVPLVTKSHDGFISSSELRWACVVIGVLNVLSLLVEYFCTLRIYHLVPDLADKVPIILNDLDERDFVARVSPVEGGGYAGCCMPAGLLTYFQQPIAWGGLGLAMLYLNALTFGNGIVTTYLLYRNMALEWVGILRGIAAAIGLLGTVTYHLSVRRLSLHATGMWSVSYEFICLVVCFSAMYVHGDFLSVTLLIAGICLSRIGLWVFDIAVTQMQQEETPDHCRGLVGGVQKSLNAFFNLLSFAVGIAFPNPQDFRLYIAVGVTAVGSAALLYACGVYLPRCRR